jgi:hypothetical protein
LSYIGGGKGSVDVAVIPLLKVSFSYNFVVESPYPDLRLHAVAQVMEGDQISSDGWDIMIHAYSQSYMV